MPGQAERLAFSGRRLGSDVDPDLQISSAFAGLDLQVLEVHLALESFQAPLLNGPDMLLVRAVGKNLRHLIRG